MKNIKKIIYVLFFLTLFMMLSVCRADAMTVIDSDSISEDTTWYVDGSPYIVTRPLTVQSNTTLSIDAGVVVKFDTYAQFDIAGQLVVAGTENEPVILTSRNDDSVGVEAGFEKSIDPSVDDYWGLNTVPGTVLNMSHTKISYAGFGVFFWGISATIDNLDIKETLSLTVADTDITLSNLSLKDSPQGLEVYSGKLTLESSTVENVYNGDGVKVYTNAELLMNNSTISDIGTFDRGVVGMKGSRIEITNSLLDNAGLYGIKLYDNSSLKFSNSRINDSSFAAINASGNYSGSQYIASVLVEDSVFDSGLSSCFELYYASSTIVGNKIVDFPEAFVLFDVSNALMSNNEILDNHTAIFAYGKPTMNASMNSFIGSTYGLFTYYAITSNINLANNWWGDASGPLHVKRNPYGLGSEIIRDDVIFEPWLLAPPGEDPEPQEIKNDPVIIVPGILGSARKNGTWVIDPVFHVYDNLIETLDANGYDIGVDLFTFPYDWRNSNVDTAVLLKEKIDEVKEICNCSQVDLIAHSMGGLVARVYAQSANYENDIDQLIFLGTPHRGSPKAYLAWEAGEFPSNPIDWNTKRFLAGEAKRIGYKSLYEYIQDWKVTGLVQLLPVYDYIRDWKSMVIKPYPHDYPTNPFLQDLNIGLTGLLQSDINITNIVGNSGSETIKVLRVMPSTNPPLWPDGKPQGFNTGVFTDEGQELGVGDDTVPVESSTLGESFDVEIESNHTNLPTKAQSKIYKLITNGKELTSQITKSIPVRMITAKIFSPADIMMVAPDGKRVGKDFETGDEINEIDGAFYSGFETEDEYITIPDLLPGQYVLKTIGTGEGGEYELVVTSISDEGMYESSSEGVAIAGVTEENIFNLASTTSDVKFENETTEEVKEAPEELEESEEITDVAFVAGSSRKSVNKVVNENDAELELLSDTNVF